MCRIEPEPLRSADEWLRFYEAFWSRKLDDLEAILRADDAAAMMKGGMKP